MPDDRAGQDEGEPLTLSFANTAGFHALDDRLESLNSFSELLSWAAASGILGKSERKRWIAQIPEHDQAALLASARSLRDSIQSIFSRLARRRPPSPADLNRINEELSFALPQLEVVRDGAGYGWAWKKSERPERLFWPIVRSAADLLVSPDRSRLRECAGRDCSRLFVDRSRNGSRRWCSMQECGNRAKARRFYKRKREGRPSA